MPIEIDYELLDKYFSYNPKSGVIKRRIKVNKYDVGSIVGFKHICGAKNSKKTYLRVVFRGSHVYVHRLAWVLMTGDQPKEIDHIDGNGLNNKWDNLRSVSHSVNGKNQKIHVTNTSGTGGVCYRKDSSKWRARIMVDDKMISLGAFKDKRDAIKARKDAELRYGFK